MTDKRIQSILDTMAFLARQLQQEGRKRYGPCSEISFQDGQFCLLDSQIGMSFAHRELLQSVGDSVEDWPASRVRFRSEPIVPPVRFPKKIKKIKIDS